MIWQKIIRWSFYALFILVPLIFTTQTSELFEFPKITLTYFLASIIITAWACRMITESRFIFRRTPLDIPILVFLFSQLLSFLFSLDQHMSWFGYYGRWNGGLLSLIVYALLYWAFVSNLDKKAATKICHLAFVIGGFVSVWAILEKIGIYPSCLLTRGHLFTRCWVQDIQGRPFATLGQPNWLASYLLALMFIPISEILKTKSQQPNKHSNIKNQNVSDLFFSKFSFYLDFSILNLIFALLMLLALWFTHSRSGFLAFAIGLLVFMGLRFSRKFFSFIFLVVLGVFIYTFTLLHCDTSTTAGTESFCIRKIVWSGALAAWQHSPKTVVVGWGPETFMYAYYRYRPLAHNLTSEWDLLYNKAHNEYLNYLTTTGVIGLIAYLYLLFSMIRAIYLSSIPSPNLGEGRRGEVFALPAGFITILVTNFFGFSVTITNLLLFLLPAIAVTLNLTPSPLLDKERGSRGEVLLLVFPVSALCIVLYALLRFVQADIAYSTGHTYLSAFQTDFQADQLVTSYDQLSHAFQLSPHEPTYASELGLAAAYSAVLTADADASYSASLAESAIQLSQLATSHSPNPNYYRTQAKIYVLLGRTTDAIASLLQAAALSPTDPRLPAGLASLYATLGDASSSARFASSAALLKPDLDLK